MVSQQCKQEYTKYNKEKRKIRKEEKLISNLTIL